MSSQRMSSADAAWLHMDRPTNLMVVNAVMWTDDPIDEDLAREVVRERLVERFPRYTQRIAEPRFGLGVPSWEDDPNFDLDLHLHHVALPAPGGEAELQALVADLMATPLDRSKPLWHTYLVDGYKGGSAVITRMHHAIADGIALARVLLSLTDERPGQGIAAPTSTPAKRGRVSSAAHAAEALAHESFELVVHPRTAIDDAKALASLAFEPADKQSILKGPLGAARKVTWIDGIPLKTVKRIGHGTGTTVNDVLIAAMTGALHQYLEERGGPLDQITAMVPFNLRPLDEPLPRELGNRFGLVELHLPVGLGDREERLAAVHAEMEGIKGSAKPAMSYLVLGVIGNTPLPVEQRALDFFTRQATAVMTNVPGPKEPVYFAGAQVKGVLGWVPAAGEIGFGMCIFSYAGEVAVGLSVDAARVPDPERILTLFESELDELRRLEGRRRRAAAARRRRREPIEQAKARSHTSSRKLG